MEKEIEELSLLLMYLTSWEEKLSSNMPPRYGSWKGYRFEIIDELEKEGFITQGSYRSKSVYLTEKGIKQAEELQKKYRI